MAPVYAQDSAIPGAIPQNGRKRVRDVAEPPSKISCRSVKTRLRNPLPYIKKEKKREKGTVNLVSRPYYIGQNKQMQC